MSERAALASGTMTAPRILCVDDDARNRRLLDALLVPAGYEVIAADSGERALEILRTQAIDLVLLDLMMPGMDGIEACRRIRGELGQRFLPVVFVTALGDRDSRVRGKEAGGDDFLTKPVDEVELLVRVRNLLDAKAYHDLRERNVKHLEQELEKRSAQLVRADRLATLGTLAGGVGHELNNICAVFFSTVHFIKKSAATGQVPEAEDLANLARVGDHLKTHAAHLLSLGRPGPDHAERLDLRDVVTSTLAMLRLVGRTKVVEVETILPPACVAVTVNRTRIEQVLVNLVGNAADALEGVRGRPQRIRVVVSAADPGGRVRVCIEDTGTGIPEGQRAAVFEPYVTTKAPGKGTGLGLPVVKHIIESYGGGLTMESRLDVGTTMTFDLPAADEPADAAAEARTTQGGTR